MRRTPVSLVALVLLVSFIGKNFGFIGGNVVSRCNYTSDTRLQEASTGRSATLHIVGGFGSKYVIVVVIQRLRTFAALVVCRDIAKKS